MKCSPLCVVVGLQRVENKGKLGLVIFLQKGGEESHKEYDFGKPKERL